ncbi:hypothetical protein OIO90_000580 [Microbotryomycetes sp. JL221]|nr:hypothetical protein OIO90_000580 [Microbotryomycetes sp. JL221]
MLAKLAITLAVAAGLTSAQHPANKWSQTYGPQGNTPASQVVYTGFNSFAHLEHYHDGCLNNDSLTYDFAVFGAPIDTLVTFRPGARFGPYAIRSGSRRQRTGRGYHPTLELNPYIAGGKTLDCGDVPMSPYRPELALEQLQVAYETLLNRPVNTPELERQIDGLRTVDGLRRPRLVAMGGDHTIVLPILRALKPIYGPISVIHFDSHLDDWVPAEDMPGATHGTFFHQAAQEGLMGPSIHAGIRTRLSGTDDSDYVNSESCGFQVITTEDIDLKGPKWIQQQIRERVGNNPVYVSLDIDVVDPAFAPATGTPESGGFSSREIKTLIRDSLVGLNIVGFDIVEVAPAYDTNAEITGILAADLVHEFLSVAVKTDELYRQRKAAKEQGANGIAHEEL